tara:strand:- start:1255 stop:3177 length:1923 start_codon:yes stop_codon:yes gene_type:complete
MIPHIPETITDTELRSAIMEGNLPTLLVVLNHLGEDDGLLEVGEQPSRGTIDGVHRISEASQTAIRERTFSALKKLRDGTIELPHLPDEDRLQQLASLLVGESVPPEYIPMLLEDMGFNDYAERTDQASTDPPSISNTERFSTIIIGCGVSGICMAVHLARLGQPYTIIEKNPSAGGTWLENTYPGCGVDSPNHFYSFSFEPNNDWPDFYSKREALHRYLEKVVDKYDIRRHVRFNTEVLGARYQLADRCWHVQTKDNQGALTERRANFLISAVGQLNRPFIPDIAGMKNFSGNQFHSARWNHNQDLVNARIGVIGTGASAMQIVPEIAPQAETLTVFQRTRHWIRFLDDYHRQVSSGKKWLLSHVPYYRNWYRFKLFWVYGDGIWESLHLDPAWPHPARSMNAENDRHRQLLVQNLTEALDSDADLMAKVIPDYPPFAKRMLIDNHWCKTLKRNNVELVTGPVKKITRKGIVDSQDTEHSVDVIIYATGFEATYFLKPMDIRGRSGQSLTALWGDDARMHLGMTLPDFPNFFVLYGPNTNLAHGGSHIFHVECQSQYIAKCITHMIGKNYREIEVRREPYEDYNRRLDEKHAQLVWSHPGVDSWYKNSRGRVVSVSPWRLVDYFHMTREPDLGDFNLAR